MCLSVSSNEPGIKYETSSIIWQVSHESKIQLVNFELSPKLPLGHLSLLYRERKKLVRLVLRTTDEQNGHLEKKLGMDMNIT